jgi:hypothetical protein
MTSVEFDLFTFGFAEEDWTSCGMGVVLSTCFEIAEAFA